MADTSSFSASSKSPAAKKGPNLSGGWIVMVMSGLIAIVIFFALTVHGTSKTTVVVAKKNIQPGQTVDASYFTTAEVNVGSTQLSHLFPGTAITSLNGQTATGPVSAGDLISKTQFISVTDKNGLRAISIPRPKQYAVDGALHVGDRVDVSSENDAAIKVYDVEVIAIDTSAGGNGLTSGGSASAYTVTVAVNSTQAAAISGLNKDGKLDIIRSTGATPVASDDSSTTSTTVGK